MQTACGVDDHDIRTGLHCGTQRIEGDRSRVGRHVLTDDGYIDALSPDIKLLDSGGSEGIPCAEHHRVALLLELIGELTDGRGLPHAIDPDDHDDIGLLTCGQGKALAVGRAVLREERSDLATQDTRKLRGGDILVTCYTLLDTADDLQGRLYADVAGHEDVLQLIEHGVIDGATPSDSTCELGEDILLSLREPFVKRLFLLLREESE